MSFDVLLLCTQFMVSLCVITCVLKVPISVICLVRDFSFHSVDLSNQAFRVCLCVCTRALMNLFACFQIESFYSS